MWNKKKKKHKKQALFHLSYPHILLLFLPPLRPPELQGWQFWHWWSDLDRRATARRCLVLVKTPEVDRLRNRICGEKREGGGPTSWKYQVMTTNWDPFNLECFLHLCSLGWFKSPITLQRDGRASPVIRQSLRDRRSELTTFLFLAEQRMKEDWMNSKGYLLSRL